MKLFGAFRRKNQIKSVVTVAPVTESANNNSEHSEAPRLSADDNSSSDASTKERSLLQRFQEFFFSERKIVVICSMVVLMCTMIVLSQVILPHPLQEKVDLNKALIFQLVSSISFVLDFLSEWLFQYPTFSLEICHILAVFIFLTPNLFIFLNVFTCGASPLIFYYQYCSVVCVLMYKVLTLSDPTVKLDNNYYRLIALVIISSLIAFLYNLSRFDIIPGKTVLKYLFVASMIGLNAFAIVQAYILTRYSYRFKKKILYVPSQRFILQSFIFILLCTIFPVIYYLATIQDDVIFFPTNSNDSYRIVYFFALSIIGLVMVRNFEIREENIALQTQLEHNRKMTRSISHEIRTPLTTAFMGLELLQDGLRFPDPKETEADRMQSFTENVDGIRDACVISIGILNQLLTFDKLASGMLTIEKKLISLVTLLEVNAKLFRMQAIQAGISFGVDMNQDEKSFFHDIVVHIDEFKINQVLRNLLSNAMKFTPKKGSVRIKTSVGGLSMGQHSVRGNGFFHEQTQNDHANTWLQTVTSFIPFPWNNNNNEEDDISVSFNASASRSGHGNSTGSPFPMQTMGPPHIDGCKFIGMIRISIVDSGPGIAKDDQKKLFQEYVQISPGELQKGQGSGLGLSISKSIITLHGGKIGVNSLGKNQGSTFYIELPAYRRHSFSLTNEMRNEIDRDNGRSVTVTCPQPNSVSTRNRLTSNHNTTTYDHNNNTRERASSIASYHPDDYPSRNSSIMIPYHARSSSILYGRMNSHDESIHEVSQEHQEHYHHPPQQQQQQQLQQYASGGIMNEHVYPARERGFIRTSLATTIDAYEQYDGVGESAATGEGGGGGGGYMTGIATEQPLASNSRDTRSPDLLLLQTSPITSSSMEQFVARSASRMAAFATRPFAATTTGTTAGGNGVGGGRHASPWNRYQPQEQQQPPFSPPSSLYSTTTNSHTNSNTRPPAGSSNNMTQSPSAPPPSTYSSTITHRTSLTSRPRFGSHIFSRKLNVLIVDDSVMNRKMLGKLLSRDGHVVVEADDGNVAVDYIRSMLDYQRQQQQQQQMTSSSSSKGTVRLVPVAYHNTTASTTTNTTILSPRVPIPSSFVAPELPATTTTTTTTTANTAYPFHHSLSTVQDFSSLTGADYSEEEHSRSKIGVPPHLTTTTITAASHSISSLLGDHASSSSSSRTFALHPPTPSTRTLIGAAGGGAHGGGMSDESMVMDAMEYPSEKYTLGHKILNGVGNDTTSNTASATTTSATAAAVSSNSNMMTSTSAKYTAISARDVLQSHQAQASAEMINSTINYNSSTNELVEYASISSTSTPSPSSSSLSTSVTFLPVDIILMDHYMKTMNGPQAVKIIRRLGFDGPILGVSGIMDDDCDAFLKSGIDLILQKPINMASVWNALKSMKYQL